MRTMALAEKKHNWTAAGNSEESEQFHLLEMKADEEGTAKPERVQRSGELFGMKTHFARLEWLWKLLLACAFI